MNSWARGSKLVTLGAVCALACTASGQNFGSFGYRPLAAGGTWTVSKDGFTGPSAKPIRWSFVQAATRFEPLETSEYAQTVFLGDSSVHPVKVRDSLIGGSLDLYCPLGISLICHSAKAPFLSWKDGSVATDVPTPDVKWLLISFPDSQVPLVFGFDGRTASFTVEATSGGWKLTSRNLHGWMRVFVPSGTKTAETGNAAELGRLVQTVMPQEDRFGSHSPKFLGLSSRLVVNGVVGQWKFDQPWVVVPKPVSGAPVGGYETKLLGPSVAGLDGSERLLPTSELNVLFPCVAPRAGRSLTTGVPSTPPIASVSPTDAISVYELAIERLFGWSDSETLRLASEVSDKFFETASYVEEPTTGQKMPYAADGHDLDVVAAHALLAEVGRTAVGKIEPNALLTSVVARRSWTTWLPAIEDPVKVRRAAAFGAIAGGTSLDRNEQLDGAMFRAGLANYHGSHPMDAVPVPDVLSALYLPGSGSPLQKVLASPLRNIGSEGLQIAPKFGKLMLEWKAVEPKPGVLTLLSPLGMTFTGAGNLVRLDPAVLLGSYTELHYTADVAGTCRIAIEVPAGMHIPALVETPRFAEVVIPASQH